MAAARFGDASREPTLEGWPEDGALEDEDEAAVLLVADDAVLLVSTTIGMPACQYCEKENYERNGIVKGMTKTKMPRKREQRASLVLWPSINTNQRPRLAVDYRNHTRRTEIVTITVSNRKPTTSRL